MVAVYTVLCKIAFHFQKVCNKSQVVKSVAYNLLKAVLWIEMISWNNLKRSWKRTWHVLWHHKILNKKITNKKSKLKLHNQVKTKRKARGEKRRCQKER